MRPAISFAPSLIVTTISSVMLVSACTWTPSSPELMAQCTKLHELWIRYEPDPVSFHSGQRAQAELAFADCGKGRYRTGIGTLKARLSRSGFRFGG